VNSEKQGQQFLAQGTSAGDLAIESHGPAAVSFGRLLEDSDYLVLQAPLTEQTHHLIGEAELRRMKPTAILVNTARGSITAVRDFAAHEVVRVLTGKPPLSPVNADQLSAQGRRSSAERAVVVFVKCL
jgi:hypothetical protein